MGWSCTAAAAYTKDAIVELLGLETSNGLPDGGFFECGREQDDGAIIGAVWKPAPDMPGHVTRRGSFRIEPDGKVTRFPGLPASTLRQAETKGAETYRRNHGGSR